MKGKIIFSFVGGAVLGAASSFFFLKKHYNKIVKEEIESVREMYFSKLGQNVVDGVDKGVHFSEAVERDKARAAAEKNKDKPDISKYVEETLKYRRPDSERTNYAAITTTDKTQEPEESNILERYEIEDGIYMVPYSEFVMVDPDDRATLYCDDDGDVYDDEDDLVLHAEQLIGENPISYFGAETDDFAYIYNEKFEMYYELVKRDTVESKGDDDDLE